MPQRDQSGVQDIEDHMKDFVFYLKFPGIPGRVLIMEVMSYCNLKGHSGC
jgi:hypothetical protein